MKEKEEIPLPSLRERWTKIAGVVLLYWYVRSNFYYGQAKNSTFY